MRHPRHQTDLLRNGYHNTLITFLETYNDYIGRMEDFFEDELGVQRY